MSSRGLFKVSEAAVLALHSAAILAEEPARSWSTAQLAERLGASANHLAKVLQRLSKAGLVRATRGPGGGFAFEGRPADVTLLQVYEAIDGAFQVSGCLFDRPVCDGRFCILGGLVLSLEQQARDYLEKTTLADVAGRRNRCRGRK